MHWVSVVPLNLLSNSCMSHTLLLQSNEAQVCKPLGPLGTQFLFTSNSISGCAAQISYAVLSIAEKEPVRSDSRQPRLICERLSPAVLGRARPVWFSAARCCKLQPLPAQSGGIEATLLLGIISFSSLECDVHFINLFYYGQYSFQCLTISPPVCL